MKLAELLEHVEYEVLRGDPDEEMTSLTPDSREVQKGSIFICIRGAISDGHQYIDQAVQKGAAAVIVQEALREYPEGGVIFIRTPDTRLAYAHMSAAWFGHPAKKLFTIGITGTKGKTTTSYMIRNVLEACGIRTGLIGTIETIIGENVFPSERTTPESYEIQRDFDEMVKSGCRAVVMEVSSQGLMLHRTAGIQFDIGVFTNLEPDHIGPNEHSSFEQYLACKARLFWQCRTAVVNHDDRHADELLRGCGCPVERFGLSEGADIAARELRLYTQGGQIGICYHAAGLVDMEVHLAMPGKFSVYNSLCAIAVTRHLGVEPARIQEALAGVRVKGRIELIPVSNEFTLMIDYAHNAMALESLLNTLREYRPRRLVCLFGCGGNRARARRFEMGEVSGRLADLSVLTSDNPRDEEPQAILDDIVTGIQKTDGKYVAIIDRKEAIRYVIENGRPGDIIVLAGKGHEDYQEIKGVKHPMNERALVAEVLEELHGKVCQGHC